MQSTLLDHVNIHPSYLHSPLLLYLCYEFSNFMNENHQLPELTLN